MIVNSSCKMSKNACNYKDAKICKNDENMPRLKFPYEITRVKDDVNDQLLKDFTGERTCYVQVGQKKWVFPNKYAKEAENIYNFKVRKDDIWIVTFPRSGTTWTQEIVWLIANNLDYVTAAEIPLGKRSPFLEASTFVHDEMIEILKKENSYSEEKTRMIDELDKPRSQVLNNCKERRIIKTHLPFSLLPPNLLTSGCKVIYVARNPKDVAVSFYHFSKLFRTHGYTGDFPKYWDYFERNLIIFTPYFEHIKEAWVRRNEENLLFVFYEDMNKDLIGAIKKMTKFLEKNMSDQDMHVLENHVKFENFKLNKSVNLDMMYDLGIIVKKQEFVRKGQTGSWKSEFDDELNKRADKWIEENLRDTDLKYPV